MGSLQSVLSSTSTTPAIIALVLLYVFLAKRDRSNLPPAPKGLPLIGHLHLMPPTRSWIFFDELSRKLKSPLIYLNLAGQDMIVINDYDAAVELLDKRSATYSSRPRLVVADDYASTNKRLLLLPYGEKWRQTRAAFHRDMTPAKTLTYAPIQTAETKVLMRDVLRTPEKFMAHFRQYSANVILKIAYGLDSEGGNQEAIAAMYDVMERFLASANPGAHLVDLFPSLDRLPDFLSPWRRGALHQRKLNQTTYLRLLNEVRAKVDKGQLAPDGVFAARLDQDKEKFGMDDLDVAYLAGTMFEAGTDTTAAALSTFVLAAVTHPDAYKAAQTEVDLVCGDHSPTLDDFERCEYVRALCKETFRWRTVTAGGLPHLSTAPEDDFYKGFRIPAGATILANHWGICASNETYGQKYDTAIFEPRRWIDRPEGVGNIDEDLPTFGFARRLCPGKLLAVHSMFLVLSNLCYAFDIKAKEGVVLDTFAYTTGFNIEPENFECNITPRTGRAREIEHEAESARETLKSL
ncbi:cytochrome P450 [Ramaria rubella]|nr:cytochrome P450 [Ramaria rubella]